MDSNEWLRDAKGGYVIKNNIYMWSIHIVSGHRLKNITIQYFLNPGAAFFPAQVVKDWYGHVLEVLCLSTWFWP